MHRCVLLAGLLAAAAAAAQDDPFVGNWKLNPAKSTMTDVMKVASLGENKYSFDFGGGDPEIAVADGTDQPGHFGLTIALTIGSPDEWTVLRKKDGKVVVIGIWKLSADGNTLNDHYTATRPNGESNTRDYIYVREGEGSGFLGTWVSKTQPSKAVVLEIQRWQGDGLSFVTQGGTGTRNLKFDGKDYANTGASLDGMTASARRLDERSLEMTGKIKGQVRDTQEMNISPDGKSLTITLHIPGRSRPNVQVFDRM